MESKTSNQSKRKFLSLLSFPKRLIQGFVEDNCYLRASALSYYTLLSIVPLLAIIFGIAKGFGFEQALETQILEVFYQQASFAEHLIQFAKSTLENTHGSLIAGVGVIFLFWSSIGLLGSFEEALNIIWNVPKMRSLKERFLAYLPIIIFAPIFIIASSSLTYLLITKIVQWTNEFGVYSNAKPLIHMAYYALLTLLNWLFFLFLYTYMPNRFVFWKSCILASLISAISLQIAQWAFIHLQIYLTSYNAIYGSFAAIPLFLLWLQTSWLITLIGAEFSKQQVYFSYHNLIPISERGVFLLSLSLACEAYIKRLPPLSKQSLAHALGIDYFLSENILSRFCKSGLLAEVQNGFIPALPPSEIMMDEVFSAIDNSTDQLFHIKDSEMHAKVINAMRTWDLAQKNSSANISLKDLSQ